MWWTMRVMGIPEWMITLVKATYDNVKSKDIQNQCECNNVFSVDIVVHQCLVLSFLQIFIVLEVYSRDFRCGCPWELLNADDLAIVTESLEEVKKRLFTWKVKFVEKSQEVKVSNTKVLISARGLYTIKELLNFHVVYIRKTLE